MRVPQLGIKIEVMPDEWFEGFPPTEEGLRTNAVLHKPTNTLYVTQRHYDKLIKVRKDQAWPH